MHSRIIFIDKARTEGNNRFFSILGTLLLAVGGFLVGQFPLAGILAVVLIAGGTAPENLAEALEAAMQNPAAYNVDPRLIFTGYVMSFAFAWLALAGGIRWFHRRRLSDFWQGAYPTPRRLFYDGLILLALLGIVDAASWLLGLVPYSVNARPGDALITLLLALVLVPVQAGLEELLFRGYLLQLLSLAFKRFWPAAIITSVLFALMHVSNPEVQEYGVWALGSYFIFGFLACVLVFLDGNIRLAMLFHTLNNIYGFAIVSYPHSAMPVPSFFMMEEMNMTWTMLGLPLMMAVFILLIWKAHAWKISYFKTNEKNHSTSVASVFDSGSGDAMD